MRWLVDSLWFFYKGLISPIIHFLAGPGFGCRYEPSCADYARQAVHVHGWIFGGRLAIARICRCHPWADHGYDPVPVGSKSAESLKRD